MTKQSASSVVQRYSRDSKTTQETELSNFMSTVYLLMTLGLAISAGVSYFISTQPSIIHTLTQNTTSVLAIIITQVLLAMAIAYFSNSNKIKPFYLACLYIFYTAVVGVSLSIILYSFTKQNIYSAFAVTAGSFFILSLYGYFTKRDLSAIKSFAMMGLVGIIILLLLSVFLLQLQTNKAQLIICSIGVIVFSGLTAYDTQKIKSIYLESSDINYAQTKKLALIGALSLYLDFINLFLMLLRLFAGGRR